MLRQTLSWVVARMSIKSERGATAVEYGLMVALIAAVIIGAVTILGQNTDATFKEVGDAIK